MITARRAAAQSEAWRLGAAATAVIAVVLLAWALSVNYPKASYGFFSDASTYYSLGHSLADDGDFEFRREDLVRIWREFPSGPEGIFLKRGSDPDLRVDGAAPFMHVDVHPDADPTRLYFAKSFLYPLAAAPFVRLFGTNGFLVLHALVVIASFLCAYAFLVARSQPVVALLFAGTFVFVSVEPVYLVWLTPDLFNSGLVMLGYFFWLYKEVASPTRPSGSARTPWLVGPRTDIIAAVWLGLATFSKPTHVLLMLPVLALFAWRRQWRRGVVTGVVFTAVVLAFLGANVAITGEANFQGGNRKTFYSGGDSKGFPFQTADRTFESTGIGRGTDGVLFDVLVNKNALLEVFPRNLVYFLVGRHTGFAAYYFPGTVAVLLFLGLRRQQTAWGWLTLAGGVGSAIALMLYMPFTYSGGGGPVGNRYFLGVYPVFLFLMPGLARPWAAVATAAVSALFVTPVLSNPFFSSFHPGEHTKSGLYRYLPLELSLINDLPVNVSPSRSRQPLGGVPPLSGYFVDDNAYNREGDAFWVRGESRADVMLRAPAPMADVAGGDQPHSLRVPRMELMLETGPKPNRITIRTGAAEQVVDIPANDRRTVILPMGEGLPYKPYPGNPTNYVYAISIESATGFIPLFDTGGRDNRFLGVFVRMTPLYE
ncbi:MAG TPA: glycosyltransferase family 87 protein [Vicinamibacterales bacterium]|nr:glycosyltransferase family 87 protein [Vicinamibacterales bacterium]